jgi:hypothetical protein
MGSTPRGFSRLFRKTNSKSRKYLVFRGFEKGVCFRELESTSRGFSRIRKNCKLPQAGDRRNYERMTHGQIIYCMLSRVISLKTTPQDRIGSEALRKLVVIRSCFGAEPPKIILVVVGYKRRKNSLLVLL